ncbi:MAG TPA: SDR family oxidoreductase [Verrucomicrobiae bacterium]|nr:SDR family oxidoreductase [Verrucomicrobiae bacterium]
MYKEKKAVVIGGTSGMGYAVVEKLVNGGAEVILTGLNEAKLQEAAAKSNATALRSDVTKPEEISRLYDAVKQKFGTFDYLFINTGICEIETLREITEDSYDRHFAINTKGPLFTIQKLEPLMNDGGAIVFTSSIADSMGIPGGLVYSATKAALVSFTKVLAAELAPRQIRVNAISVGFANTPTMGMNNLNDAERKAFADDGAAVTPLGRLASVEEFAATAVFLAHEATMITGVNLPLDGGIELGVFAQPSQSGLVAAAL